MNSLDEKIKQIEELHSNNTKDTEEYTVGFHATWIFCSGEDEDTYWGIYNLVDYVTKGGEIFALEGNTDGYSTRYIYKKTEENIDNLLKDLEEANDKTD